jgi:hypothetical protein
MKQLNKKTVMKAKTIKNQSLLNKVVKALEKYNQLNNLRDKADNEGNEREYKKLDNKCLNAFDKYLELLNELPKYEQTRIEKSDLYLIG